MKGRQGHQPDSGLLESASLAKGKRKYVSLDISVKEKDLDFKKIQSKKSCPDREAIVKLISDKLSNS